MSFRSNVVSIKCRFDQMSFRSSIVSIKFRFDQVSFRSSIVLIKCRSINCHLINCRVPIYRIYMYPLISEKLHRDMLLILASNIRSTTMTYLFTVESLFYLERRAPGKRITDRCLMLL